MTDALAQKIQLDEHGKFRCYVMFATMDMPIYDVRCQEIVNPQYSRKDKEMRASRILQSASSLITNFQKTSRKSSFFER
jgi:hypothetical protein